MSKASKWVCGIFFLLFLGFSGMLNAQTTSNATKIFLPIESHFKTVPQFNRLFPEYVQNNPQELAPLCKLELKIEKEAPIGMWFRIDEDACKNYNSAGLAYFRFRFKL